MENKNRITKQYSTKVNQSKKNEMKTIVNKIVELIRIKHLQ